MDLASKHLRWGWWSLLGFLTLGIALEAFHGFKVDWYLDPAYETRRLLWRLAHAHGVLLSVVHIAFAATCRLEAEIPAKVGSASRALIAAGVLLPGGFFLGGVTVHGGDPGAGIFLAPVGAALLFYSVFVTARSLRRSE